MATKNLQYKLRAARLELQCAQAWLAFHTREREYGAASDAALACENMQADVRRLTHEARMERADTSKLIKAPIPKGWTQIDAAD
jgi:hypothetical protein